MRADGTDRRESVQILKVGLRDLPARPARGRHPIDVHASAIIRQEGDPRTIWRPARHGLVVGAARDETRFSTPERHDGNIHRPVQGVVVGHLGPVGRPATRQREPVRICQRANRQCRRARPAGAGPTKLLANHAMATSARTPRAAVPLTFSALHRAAPPRDTPCCWWPESVSRRIRFRSARSSEAC